jgi:hypothetical protein
MIRRQFDLDAPPAMLGHSARVVTEIGTDLDQDIALEILAKFG